MMSRRRLWAFLILAISIIVVLLNAGGGAALSFGLFELRADRGIVYACLIGMGALIGLLIRR